MLLLCSNNSIQHDNTSLKNENQPSGGIGNAVFGKQELHPPGSGREECAGGPG